MKLITEQLRKDLISFCEQYGEAEIILAGAMAYTPPIRTTRRNTVEFGFKTYSGEFSDAQKKRIAEIQVQFDNIRMRNRGLSSLINVGEEYPFFVKIK